MPGSGLRPWKLSIDVAGPHFRLAKLAGLSHRKRAFRRQTLKPPSDRPLRAVFGQSCEVISHRSFYSDGVSHIVVEVRTSPE
jgi:hypothetical protein